MGIKKLSWFPVYGNIQGAVEEMRAESVKSAFLSALRYINGAKESVEMDDSAKMLFYILRQNVNDAKKDYEEISKKRAAAARARWEADKNKR